MTATPLGYTPQVTVLRNRYVAGDAARGVLVAPLSAALLRAHPNDCHFQQGHAASGAVQRVTKGMIETGGAVMTCLAFDLDGPEHVATAAWRTETEANLKAVLAAHPAGFVYSTRNGYRLLWSLEPIVIASAADAKEWARVYCEVCDDFAARFGLDCDRSCSDPARLFRLPFVARTPGEATPAVSTIGNANAIGVFPLAFVRPAQQERPPNAATPSPAASERSERSRPVEEDDQPRGSLYEALNAAGLIVGIGPLPRSLVIECPRSSFHTTGAPGDGSTLLYLPSWAGGSGFVSCQHNHCRGLDARKWKRSIAALVASRRALQVAPAAPRTVLPHPEAAGT